MKQIDVIENQDHYSLIGKNEEVEESKRFYELLQEKVYKSNKR